MDKYRIWCNYGEVAVIMKAQGREKDLILSGIGAAVIVITEACRQLNLNLCFLFKNSHQVEAIHSSFTQHNFISLEQKWPFIRIVWSAQIHINQFLRLPTFVRTIPENFIGKPFCESSANVTVYDRSLLLVGQ